MTQSGVIAGTPLYMAPEQARGETLDPRADLFSLGSVLYTMASGRPPFRASTSLAVLKRVAEDTPRKIREVVPEVPQWLCDLIAKLHAKDPAQRFQSAREVAEVFGQHLAHMQHPNLVPLPHTMQSGPHSRRRQMAAFGGAIAVLAAFVLLINPPWHSPGPASDTTSSADAAPAAVEAEGAVTPVVPRRRICVAIGG